MNPNRTQSDARDRNIGNIPLWAALLPVIALIALLAINVYLYGADSSYGPNQIALLMGAATAACMGWMMKIPTVAMLDGIKSSIASTLVAMLILLLIGSLAGTWMVSGIIPAMIYYGLDVLNPKIFLFATAVVCCIVSLVTGSSWSTVATVGVALLGIGTALGVGSAVAAGAIISGAYFGDKISPLSDTTNLASAMAGTDLFTHIKYMLWTTIPSMTIALGIYLAIGLTSEPQVTAIGTDMLKQEIASRFSLNPLIFVVPVLVLAMVVIKIDAVVALFVGAVAGGLVAVIFQPEMVTTIADLPDEQVSVVAEDGTESVIERRPAYIKRAYVAFTNAMAFETRAISADRQSELEATKVQLQSQLEQKRFEAAALKLPGLTMAEFRQQPPATEEEFPEIERALAAASSEIAAADLLKGKGMIGMLNTIWLIITAMCFGGVMEACGLLQRITQPLVLLAQSNGSLIATTAGSCVFTNITASDQYLSIVVPGRMFRETFRERGLAPQNLSRTLEDAGTVTSVLIPWNTCGAAQQAVLGVGVLMFAPYCFFNIISPLMTTFFGFAGIRIAKLDDEG
jgi:NhaC family Na+:H+ antiporter